MNPLISCFVFDRRRNELSQRAAGNDYYGIITIPYWNAKWGDVSLRNGAT
jgi:hypothetical protein